MDWWMCGLVDVRIGGLVDVQMCGLVDVGFVRIENWLFLAPFCQKLASS